MSKLINRRLPTVSSMLTLALAYPSLIVIFLTSSFLKRTVCNKVTYKKNTRPHAHVLSAFLELYIDIHDHTGLCAVILVFTRKEAFQATQNKLKS